jgi:uronate dehydrogenase
MTVLLTGAAGRIGSELTAQLPSFGWTVRGFDREQATGADAVVGDTTSPADLDAAMSGVTAVVHLAGVPTEAPWPALREANIEGTFQVFEAARRHGIERVVHASSLHAAGFTPVAAGPSTAEPPRPDTLYGVSKVFGEVLGRYYADRYGLRVACLRIGTYGAAPRGPGELATWLSIGDCARLVDACLRAPDLSYAVLWGFSANSRRTWPLDDALALGYRPEDDAEEYADALRDAPSYPSDVLLGGGFTTAGFGIDEVLGRS